MKIENFQSQVCVCAASTNLKCAKSCAEMGINMEKKISEICEELCLKKIAWDEELIATGVLNSFILMELICRLEKEFQVVFTAEEISELENFSCINNMAALLCVKRKSKDLE